MRQIEGGCLCGQVQYEARTEPIAVALCHCRHCQKQSGAAYSVNVGLPRGALQFTAGRTKVFEDTGSSGQKVYRHFCGDCGSPIFSDLAARPTMVWLKAGTLTDTSWVRPTMALWCDSAQTWVGQALPMTECAKGPPAR